LRLVKDLKLYNFSSENFNIKANVRELISMGNIKKTVTKILSQFFDGTQMAIALVEDGVAEYHGFIKQKKEIISVDNQDRIFEISSITKVFTSTILAQLVLENKIKLDDRVGAVLNSPALLDAGITFQHLANHSSGLPRLPDNFYTIPNHLAENPYLHYEESALQEYLTKYMQLTNKPGTQADYSNLGFGLLSYALVRVEELPFTQIVQQRIFDQLGMRDSTFELAKAKAQLVAGIDQAGKESGHWAGGILNGALGILSTAEDMVKFVAYINREDNPVAALAARPTIKMAANHMLGLAWGIRILEDGSYWYNHGGGSAGYNSFLKINRQDKKALVLLSNVSAFHPEQKQMDVLAQKLQSMLF